MGHGAFSFVRQTLYSSFLQLPLLKIEKRSHLALKLEANKQDLTRKCVSPQRGNLEVISIRDSTLISNSGGGRIKASNGLTQTIN